MNGLTNRVALLDTPASRPGDNVNATADIEKIAASAAPVPSNCVGYAIMMNYLCGRVHLPCIMVFGEGHCWNLIYADEAWGYTDVSHNAQVYGHRALLLNSAPPKQMNDPAGMRFLQELLMPNSTY